MSPLRVLVTAFEPFGGETTNPSEQILRGLDGVDLPGDLVLRTAVLPVDRTRYRAALDAALDDARPDLVVSLGQATGRPRVDLESTARNRIDFDGAVDNGGHAATDEALEAGGPDRRESPLPLGRLAEELAAEGHAVAVSDDAGRHLCNATYYELLGRGCRAVFVHVPLTPDQAARRTGAPSMPLPDSAAAVHALLRRLGSARIT